MPRAVCVRIFALWIAVIGLAASARAAKDEIPPLSPGATEFMVAMRDGVKLATNFIPPNNAGSGPWPVVVTRTPYGKDNRQFAMLVSRYVGNGYAYVVQDCRGKFKSEGEYRPFENDREDGYDTIEWAAAQAFCNGKVGISGASAMGITSNLAASANPPHLVAAYVVVAPHSLFAESSFVNGVFKEADVGNWMKSNGAGDLVPEVRGRVLMSDRWKSYDLPFFIDNIDIPIYNVGGWYDMFCQGNLNNFVYLQNKGAEGAKGNQKLLMGPFGHGKLTGDLAYPADGGLVGAFKEELRWFDHWLKGVDNGIMAEPPVKYYRMASARKGKGSKLNGYLTAPSWPPPSTAVRYYLRDGMNLTAEPPAEKNSSTAYEFDPANPVPTFGGANLTLPLGPIDQRQIPARPDYLRFQTAPLEKNVSVAGKIDVELWVSSDAPDTDFMAKLVDVYPDGYEAIIQDGPARARYRDGRNPGDVKPLTKDVPVKLTLDLWSTANVFEAGHRIALHVTSSNAPRFEVNPNNMAGPNETLPPRKARNVILHGAEHPSALVLPVLQD